MTDSWVGAENWDRGGVDPMPRGRKTVLVICCTNPNCESVDVLRRAPEVGDLIAWWQCKVCNARWKEPAGSGEHGRGWIA